MMARPFSTHCTFHMFPVPVPSDVGGGSGDVCSGCQVDGMTSHLAQLGFTKKPKMIPKVCRANLKKRMQQDERLAEIEAENARLLSQMTRIMDAPDQLSRLKKPPLSSLNVVTRRREMERVTHENLRMLRALEETPSYYNHRVWLAERREQEHMLSYIGMYPYGDGTGIRARSQTHSHTDVDDVWLRSVTSLSRKSALSLPELTKGRDMRFSRADSPGQPWALPVLPGQEHAAHTPAAGGAAAGAAPLAMSDLGGSGATAPMRDAGAGKSMDKLRADSSSESEGEEEEAAPAVKKSDEPKPVSQSVSQHKPSAPVADKDADSDDDDAAAAKRPAAEAAKPVSKAATPPVGPATQPPQAEKEQEEPARATTGGASAAEEAATGGDSGASEAAPAAPEAQAAPVEAAPAE